jgi:hypothetical protein
MDFPPIPGLAPTSEAMLNVDVPAYASPPGSAHAPPRFYKLDFPTFDGPVDPLNWLNQCEQFFYGQRTLASDRTWLASYHLRGATQTWYYALERDEGMLTWERFHVVCQLQFRLPTQGTRLAKLARLPFTSTVQEYAERYNAVLCHTDDDLGPRQKAKLFVGGLLEHIWVDVEMRHPPNLQTTMYYARAFERQAVTYQALSAAPQRGPRPSPRSTLSVLPPGPVAPMAGTPGGSAPAPATAPSRFRCLSPTEQQERQCKGLCFNCDEPYVRGHVCQRLFYLHNDDYVGDVAPAEVATATVSQPPVVALPDPDPETAPTSAPHVSLHALAGVCTENAMVLHVTVEGQQLVTLLNSGFTTNFINTELCARLQLATSPRPALRVLVANGDGSPARASLTTCQSPSTPRCSPSAVLASR